MKVYIAAASREAERVRWAQRQVTAEGWTLTHDWLRDIEENLAKGLKDTDLPPWEQASHASRDLDAVDSADVVWFLAPFEPTKGAWFEVGYAFAKWRTGTGGVARRVVCSGGAPSIFCHLLHCVPTDEAAFAYLRGFCAPQLR